MGVFWWPTWLEKKEYIMRWAKIPLTKHSPDTFSNGVQSHLAVHLLLSAVMTTSEESQCSTPEGCLFPATSIRSKGYCYSAQTRSSVLQGLPFGGVPTVLVLNFVLFLVSRPLDRLAVSSRGSGDFEGCLCTCRRCCFCSPTFERWRGTMDAWPWSMKLRGKKTCFLVNTYSFLFYIFAFLFFCCCFFYFYCRSFLPPMSPFIIYIFEKLVCWTFSL